MRKPVYYGDYLHLEKLLDCQHRESMAQGNPAHDEMLFIIVHQAYELWFKQILFELDAVYTLFTQPTLDERDLIRTVSMLERVEKIQLHILGQLDILETMTPLDFLDFRDLLMPASGFQSWQFRLIETRFGLPMKNRVHLGSLPYFARLKGDERQRLESAETQPSLFDLVERWLERTPFLTHGRYDFWSAYRQAVDDMIATDRAHINANPDMTDDARTAELAQLDSTHASFEVIFDEARHAQLRADGAWRFSHTALKAALFIALYRHQPLLAMPFKLLTVLMDIDANWTTWRQRHAQMAQRMIGTKIGTGGSSGYDYLRATAEKHKAYGDLVALSTFFIPRSRLPDLPREVERRLGFHDGDRA